MNLLIEIVKQRWRDRNDFFVGGNMFIYFSAQQVLNRDYRGPDFFVVTDIEEKPGMRGKWVVWEENGRYPDVIVELMSPSTFQEDLGAKKELYERTFRTTDYFCYDPETEVLYGWHLGADGYQPLKTDQQGRMWSEMLDAWIGPVPGEYLNLQWTWLRLFDAEGSIIPIAAEAERTRADAEAARA
ncbi:MAG: Uma2 family endonuclease, partial [Caldilineaceae bacterium]|nr:Uma2 family endonuclease [Caldilineaceae bacterium]